ncbi:MAG: type I-C CRISPR-associated protein Cas8c/Csd1, partial [Clostridiales bacterium]|nr:type I-C CRISPR-associated protein Cas8c/Csd1 [Clostridiales bacterium]
MGLLQKALETYEAMEGLVGIYEDGKEEPLAPIGHIVTKAQIEVTINADGTFVGAKQADKDQKIIIPVTEESSGRTSSPAAHPLCEQLGYLLGDDEVKFDLYINNLTQWCQSAYAHPKAKAVLTYTQQRTLRSDLINAGISLDKEKDMVCWRVLGFGISDHSAVWEDVDLMKAYSSYYLSQKQGETNL